jgi:hypothetical protein
MMKKIWIFSTFAYLFGGSLIQAQSISDRTYWVDLVYRISEPVLSNMSKGELKKNMPVEYSPAWDGRNNNVAYMEAFGRLMLGIAPWLALPDDDTPEGEKRKQLREWALSRPWLWRHGNTVYPKP